MLGYKFTFENEKMHISIFQPCHYLDDHLLCQVCHLLDIGRRMVPTNIFLLPRLLVVVVAVVLVQLPSKGNVEDATEMVFEVVVSARCCSNRPRAVPH